jgi:predicted transcriptional regulator of viral defense system
MSKIAQLYQTKKNIFTIQDLGVIWQQDQRSKLIESIKYYLRKGPLKKIQRGLYYLGEDYDNFELAQKIIPASYISFYTALAKHGIIFQYYKTKHSAAGRQFFEGKTKSKSRN